MKQRLRATFSETLSSSPCQVKGEVDAIGGGRRVHRSSRAEPQIRAVPELHHRSVGGPVNRTQTPPNVSPSQERLENERENDKGKKKKSIPYLFEGEAQKRVRHFIRNDARKFISVFTLKCSEVDLESHAFQPFSPPTLTPTLLPHPPVHIPLHPSLGPKPRLVHAVVGAAQPNGLLDVERLQRRHRSLNGGRARVRGGCHPLACASGNGTQHVAVVVLAP